MVFFYGQLRAPGKLPLFFMVLRAPGLHESFMVLLPIYTAHPGPLWAWTWSGIRSYRGR